MMASYVLLGISIITILFIPMVINEGHIFYSIGYGGVILLVTIYGVVPFLGSYFCYPNLIRSLFIPRRCKQNWHPRQGALAVEFALLFCGLGCASYSTLLSQQTKTQYFLALILVLMSLWTLLFSLLFFGRYARMSRRILITDAVRAVLRFLVIASIVTSAGRIFLETL